MNPYRLLIPVFAVCLLLTGAHDSRSAVPVPATGPRPVHVQAQPDAQLPSIYFHPRFYKDDGETGRSSTLYLQNPNPMPGIYVLEFYDCSSGALVFPPAPPTWDISPGATRVAGPRDFPDLPSGCYGLVVVSDTDLAHASLVEETRSGAAADRLATHPGFARAEAASELRFGPLLKGEVASTVHIWNVTDYASATLTANAYDEAGDPTALPSFTLAPLAQGSYTLTQLSPSFTGTLVIQSTGGSAMGLMALESTSGATNEYRKPLAAGATEVCLPRVLKHVNEGGVTRSTALFVANTTGQAANVRLRFYEENGAPLPADQDLTLAANGSRYLRLADIAQLGDGIWSVCASGNRPVAIEELTGGRAVCSAGFQRDPCGSEVGHACARRPGASGAHAPDPQRRVLHGFQPAEPRRHGGKR